MRKPGKGTTVNVSTSLQSETLVMAGIAMNAAVPSMYRGKVVRLECDADAHYNLTGSIAVTGDPSIRLKANTERYEFVPWDGDISVIGISGNFVITLMG